MTYVEINTCYRRLATIRGGQAKTGFTVCQHQERWCVRSKDDDDGGKGLMCEFKFAPLSSIRKEGSARSTEDTVAATDAGLTRLR